MRFMHLRKLRDGGIFVTIPGHDIATPPIFQSPTIGRSD